MPTYYRKHQQIKAFQFDGSLTQLKQELPTTLFKQFATPDAHGQTFTFVKNDQNIINTIIKTRYGQ